ncbi:MAG: DUF5719 family protein [Chloroflexota bacterium]
MKHILCAKQGHLLTALVLALACGIAPYSRVVHGKGAGSPSSIAGRGDTASPREMRSGTRGSGANKGGAHAPTGMGRDSQIYFAEGFTGQGPDVDFTEHLTILNTNALTATGQIDYYLTGDISATTPITVPITVPAHGQLIEDVGQDVGLDQTVSAVVQTDEVVAAARTISRTTVAGVSLGESITPGVDTLAQFWYFAEGYTGASFQEYLALFNPGASPATVTVEPVGGNGSQVSAPLTSVVPPHARITVNLRAAIPGRSIGMSVQSDQPIAAERVLYWGDGTGSAKFGTAVTGGIRGPAALWTFPFVSTVGSDQAFLSFIDPTTVAAHVQLTAFGPPGVGPMPRTVTVAAGARATVALPAQLEAMAIVASSDVPVIAEEGQYFGGSPNMGAHMGSVVAGTPQPASQWAFPGISDPAFTDLTWYVFNRGSAAATVTVTVLGQGMAPAQTRIRADPGKLTVVNLASIRAMRGAAGSLWVSNSPVVITQVIRGADPTVGAIVSGVPQTP